MKLTRKGFLGALAGLFVAPRVIKPPDGGKWGVEPSRVMLEMIREMPADSYGISDFVRAGTPVYFTSRGTISHIPDTPLPRRCGWIVPF